MAIAMTVSMATIPIIMLTEIAYLGASKHEKTYGTFANLNPNKEPPGIANPTWHT